MPLYHDHSEEAIRDRDEALRGLAHSFYGSLAPSAQAKALHDRSKRFATTCWRIEAVRAEMPGSYRGTEKEFMWRAFKSGATMPICERQLRTILSS